MTRALTAISLVMTLTASLVLAGCKGDSAPATGDRAEVGFADVVLKLDPDPPVALKDVVITAEVRDSGGAPVEGAKVVFDLSMPGMYHGENRPVAVEAEPGVYRAGGILTMPGRWLIAVEVKADGLDVVRKFYVDAEGG